MPKETERESPRLERSFGPNATEKERELEELAQARLQEKLKQGKNPEEIDEKNIWDEAGEIFHKKKERREKERRKKEKEKEKKGMAEAAGGAGPGFSWMGGIESLLPIIIVVIVIMVIVSLFL